MIDYRNHLADTLAELGFAAGQTDIEGLGDWWIRTFRLDGVQVEVNEENGTAVVSDWGWDTEHKHGYDYRIELHPSVPVAVITATVKAVMDEAKRYAAGRAEMARFAPSYA